MITGNSTADCLAPDIHFLVDRFNYVDDNKIGNSVRFADTSVAPSGVIIRRQLSAMRVTGR